MVAGNTPVLVHNSNGPLQCVTAYKLSLNTMRQTGTAPEDLYQIAKIGDLEYQATGGGAVAMADGFDGNTAELLDAKFVGNPARSPFIPDSGLPDFIRAKISAKTNDLFSRYADIINDPSNPLVGLRVITNHPDAVPYFEGLMQQYNIPGSVVLSP